MSPSSSPLMEERRILEIHPGWWFKDTFSTLGKKEKIAWLELLILAKATQPSGVAIYHSARGLANALGVDESSLIKVLKFGKDRLMIYLSEYYFIGAHGLPPGLHRAWKSEIHDNLLRQLDDPNKDVTHFFTMGFPGHFQYEGAEYCPKGFKPYAEIRADARDVPESELSFELEEPYQLFKERYPKDTGSFSRIIEGNPFDLRSEPRLPVEALYVLGSPEEISKSVDKIFSNNLHLSRMAIKDLMARLLRALREMESILSDHHSKIPANSLAAN